MKGLSSPSSVAGRVVSLRPNNFDLVRLVAAMQVVIHHSIEHLELAGFSGFLAWIVFILRMFPGVPIFLSLVDS